MLREAKDISKGGGRGKLLGYASQTPTSEPGRAEFES